MLIKRELRDLRKFLQMNKIRVSFHHKELIGKKNCEAHLFRSISQILQLFVFPSKIVVTGPALRRHCCHKKILGNLMINFKKILSIFYPVQCIWR